MCIIINQDLLDKISKVLSITDKGKSIIEELLTKHINTINNIFSGWASDKFKLWE